MDDPSDSEQPAVAPPIGASPSGVPGRSSQASTSGRWDGSIGRNRKGHLATIPVIVRWDSAAVVRRALDQEAGNGIPATVAAAQEAFIITVIGLLPATPELKTAVVSSKSSSIDDPQVRGTEEILEWFMSNSHLRVKGQATLEPENVKLDADTGEVHISFRRAEDPFRNKPDVLFVTRYGSVNVQARFRTKDMIVAGHADL